MLPRGTYTILDDWGDDATMGMRASGSNSVKATDVVVPAHHVVTVENLGARPDDMVNGTPGTRLHGNPMYLGRLMGPYHASLVSPIVGAARAALDEYEEIIRAQKTMLDPTIMRADNADFQRFFGEALALTDAAEAIVIQGCERYMEYCRRWAKEGSPITVEENLRRTMINKWTARIETVELLFHTSEADRDAQRQPHATLFQRRRCIVRTSSQFSVFTGIIARAPGQADGWRGL